MDDFPTMHWHKIIRKREKQKWNHVFSARDWWAQRHENLCCVRCHADILNAKICTFPKHTLKWQCTLWLGARVWFRGMTIPSRTINIYICESTEISLWAKTSLSLLDCVRLSFWLYKCILVVNQDCWKLLCTPNTRLSATLGMRLGDYLVISRSVSNASVI
jgi:hypothetical protein